ncbi:MAG TPA: hypothetical protein VIK84_03695 [Haloplasmataceae bacterium]
MKRKYLVDRIISLCYDYILVIMMIGFTSFILHYLKVHLAIIIIIDIFIYFFAYTYICYLLKGSIGKTLNDLYVEPTSGRFTFGRVLFREIIMKQILYLTIIGFICDLVFFILKKDTLHDYYLKTTVKKKETKKEVNKKAKKNKISIFRKKK